MIRLRSLICDHCHWEAPDWIWLASRDKCPQCERGGMRRSISDTIMVSIVFALVMLVFGLLLAAHASAGERGRSWIVDDQGRTTGYVEHEPYIDGSDKAYVRDRTGDLRAVIESDNPYLDRTGDLPEPRKKWGSWGDRWGDE